MDKVFKLIPISEDSPYLMLNPKHSKLPDETMIKTAIHFGLQKIEVTCKQLNTLKENEIGLSTTVIENLQIPLEVDYEVSFQNGEIIIGPFIGVLMTNSRAKLKKKVNKLKQISKQYRLVRGVVVAFSWEGIDQNNSNIIGYIYNPSSKKWEEGTFPFPAVIVNRTALSTKRKKYLKELYGSRFLYLPSINKWKMYQRLSSNNHLIPHLPKTYLYKKPNDILKYLKKFRAIYVKPLSGLRGIGIEKFIAEPDHYCVKYRSKEENKIFHFPSENELLDYVKSKFKSKKYIIQQQIDLEIEKNHSIDFRIALIKNQSGKWEDVGIVGKKGGKGSVVSNLETSGGKAIQAKTLLLTSFNLPEAEALRIRQKMSEIAIKAAEEIDKYNTIYKSGVDIAIDRHHHIWLIELNNRNPSENIFLYVGGYDTVSKLQNAMIFYAKYLAGFPKEMENMGLIKMKKTCGIGSLQKKIDTIKKIGKSETSFRS